MSCQCYMVGGPFIAEDPDCPIHGANSIYCEKPQLLPEEQNLIQNYIAILDGKSEDEIANQIFQWTRTEKLVLLEFKLLIRWLYSK